MNKLWIALFLTIILENFVVLLWERKDYMVEMTLMNCLTNPLLNLICMELQISFPQVLIAECVVVIVEMALHHALKFGTWKECFLLSLSTNSFSYILGGLLYVYIA